MSTTTNDPSYSHLANRRPQVQAFDGGAVFALAHRGAAGRDRGYLSVEAIKVGFYQEIANA